MNANSETDLQPVAEVGAQRIAKVYAEALLNAAEKKGRTEAILEEFESLIRDVFARDARMEALLGNPAIGRKHKAEIVRALFEGRASQLFYNFLMVLNHHDRLDLLRVIQQSARRLHDDRQQRIRVRVRSAVPLAEDQLHRLTQHVRDKFRLEPVVSAEVDPDLIGGMIVRVGDWLYDASIRARLDIIRNQLIARSNYEIQTRRDRFRTTNGD